jgi:predicted nucleic acid-binding Zn ribbon protein
MDPVVRTLIAQFRRSPNWDEHLDLELLQKMWPNVVGRHLAATTRVTGLHGSTVVVHVPDPIWRKQLYKLKKQMLKNIAQLWGESRVTEIAFTYENH